MDKPLRLSLLRAVCTDRAFLRQSWSCIQASDFTEKEEAVIVEVALAFYTKHEEPIGSMLRFEAGELAQQRKFGPEARKKLAALFEGIQNGQSDLVSVKALSDVVWRLKKSTFYETALSEAMVLYDKGGLSPTYFSDLVERANRELVESKLISHSYLTKTELDKRIRRRSEWDDKRYPVILIDPLDEKIKIISKGHLGMVMAPPGGGKGLMLVHFAIAYAMQGLNVWHLTLEDPLDLVENRLDSAISGLPLNKLRSMPKTLRKRFKRQRALITGHIQLTDGTDGGYTVTRIEREFSELVREGFTPDIIIIDYDDEIECEKVFKGDSARRFEFGEIYTRLRRLARKTNTIVWTAAQPGKIAEGKRVITGKDVAEDYGKIRKVFFCLTIGSGQIEDNPDVRYAYVAKHRLDRSHFGVEFVSDFSSAVMYDRARTLEWLAAQRLKKSL